MIERWCFENQTGRRVRASLRPAGRIEGYSFTVPTEPGGYYFNAYAYQRMQLKIENADGFFTHEFYEEGYVKDLASPLFEVVGRELGVPADELYKRWKATQSSLAKPENIPGRESSSATPKKGSLAELGSGPRPEATFSASFAMNDRGGLHARPAILVHKALAPLDYGYVEAHHESNGRTVRAGPKARAKPAFWLQLLSLEAWRGEVVTFTAAGGLGQEAEATRALDAICGVLGRPMPERFDFWQELGVDLWCKTYLYEVNTPGALELQKRYQIFNKADLDKGPENTGRPAAERVE